MKKVLCIILALCSIFVITACGKDKSSDSEPVIEKTPAETLTEKLLSTKWEVIENNPETDDVYVTFYTFKEDGTCDFGYGWYLSDLMDDGTGTYEVTEDCTINLTLNHNASGITTMASYAAVIDGDSITLTQQGDAGLFYYHEVGTVLNMTPHIEEAAQGE